MMKKKQEQISESMCPNLDADSKPTQIESMCTNCEENGMTILLMTRIPFFREMLLSSFSCPHCGMRNNQIQFVGKLPDFGVQILFRLLSVNDLKRQIIKSEHAVVKFNELDLQIPTATKSQVTTIEGLLRRMHDELNFHQSVRKEHQPEEYEKLEVFLKRTRQYLDGQHFPLTVTVRDPSGSSNIKNLFAPKQDKNLEISHFSRTSQELVAMGYSPQNAKQEAQQTAAKAIGVKMNFALPFEENNLMSQEPVIFQVECHSCNAMGEMRMCHISVPYFTDLVVMSFRCDVCGTHSTETKNSGDTKDQCCEIKLKVKSDTDLKRDLFKSDTCLVSLPEIELELTHGTLGGVFTTVEGLLEKIHEHLEDTNPFADSDTEFAARMQVLLADLEAMRAGGREFTLLLSDPLGHSFISQTGVDDKALEITFRDRTFDENEDLGLNDMKTENYQVVKEPKKGG